MDRFTIYLLITVPLYFLLLHAAIIPALRNISARVQGSQFTYRLRGQSSSETDPSHAKFDLLWSFLANALALVVSVIPFAVIETLGYGARWFGA